ncbi:MAG: zinc ribbon domain-containing protein [Rhodospirillales bacterium]|nr:zinc ribbon domain-containing protein [Rhodospirillales bacterium]
MIAQEEFDEVQASLAARNPKRTPPRVVSGPTLLTGIARCATCGSGMTIRTGKGGRYRYYVCAGCAQKGKTHCPGRSIGMAALDGMILEHLADSLFTPDRLAVILEAYVTRSAEADEARGRRLAQARARATEIGGRMSRLLNLVANGSMAEDDPALKDMLADLKAQRHGAAEEIKLLEAGNAATGQPITAAKIAQLAETLRIALHSDDVAFRKAYLRLFVDEIVVGDTEIRLRGPKAALAKAAAQNQLPGGAAMVPSFVRGWRPRRDSNSRPQD